MTNQIRQFLSKFKDHNFRLLFGEGIVLSVIIGAGLASWPGVFILLVALTWTLNRQWGTVCLIGLFSCAWALLLGILALISGVKIHLRDLKMPFRSMDLEEFNANQWRQNWNLGQQNLN